jgi:hypothetical protein
MRLSFNITKFIYFYFNQIEGFYVESMIFDIFYKNLRKDYLFNDLFLRIIEAFKHVMMMFKVSVLKIVN